jgi:hypothetical protein
VGTAACIVGLALAAVQAAGPSLRPPLYDGVVVVDPYRFLEPAGTEVGGAQGASRTMPVVGGSSPAIAIGTPEQPPQAQLIAAAGALVLPAGTTTLVATITPVAPAQAPPSGAIAGNAYRVAIVNQAGSSVGPQQGSRVTLALRDPGATDLARIELLSGGTWRPLATVSAAVSGTYETTGLTTFGDFALVGSAPRGGSAAGTALSPFAIITVAAIALTLLVVVGTLLKARIGRGGG